ncbi:hypothetical protein [Clostridium transplantifaecale]|uniref:hypothetical protein n=1 Tax=Clostridium transplantifaecale TaxID=2479838 RepID=UPI000F63B8C4|nr:hypothetical protein [Clostridium transplantifaecale]
MEETATVQVELNVNINLPCEKGEMNGNTDAAFNYAKYCRDIFRIRQNLQNTLSPKEVNRKEEAHD